MDKKTLQKYINYSIEIIKKEKAIDVVFPIKILDEFLKINISFKKDLIVLHDYGIAIKCLNCKVNDISLYLPKINEFMKCRYGLILENNTRIKLEYKNKSTLLYHDFDLLSDITKDYFDLSFISDFIGIVGALANFNEWIKME